MSAKRQESLANDARNLNQAITRRTQDEVFAIARKALTDLATTSLEERMGEVFTRRLRELNDEAKHVLAEALKTTAEPALVRSAFDLPAEQRAAIQNALNETFSADIHLRFETAPDLVSGIEFTTNGQKVAWSIADYLASLEQGVGELLKEKDKPTAKPEPKPQESKPATASHERHRPEFFDLQSVFDRAFAGISQAREAFTPQLTPREVGTISSVSTGIARVSGLPGVGFEELVEFPGGVFGIAFNVDEDEIGVVLLGEYSHLHAGDEVERTGRVMDVAWWATDCWDASLIRWAGRSMATGRWRPASACPSNAPPGHHGPRARHRAAADRPQGCRCAHSHRARPARIDSWRPPDRQDRHRARHHSQSARPGRRVRLLRHWPARGSAVAKAVAILREKGALDYTVVVVTEGNDPPGLAYIAPYAATSIAEHFMEAGRDVLIVYDDLTHHARAYRELSLLLRRPPGREAFPGDIFYIHSRLLERATHLRKERGGGSLTALPIIETEAQNISAYIPTNLISITDGQIYLSPSLFELGVLPAVDVGKSVSRVGGKAQRAAYRAVAGDLKLAYAQFEELETFARFGARLDEDTRKIIEHGRRIRACLKQPEFAPVSVPAQITVLLALTAKIFDCVTLDQMTDAEQAVQRGGGEHPGGGARAIRNRRQIER